MGVLMKYSLNKLIILIIISFLSFSCGGCGSGNSNDTSSPVNGSGTTVVGGIVSKNTIWQNEISVESSVVVQPGVTLTVKPGTHVKFKYYRGYKEPEKRLRIDILGTIIAEGTSDSPIYFTSDAPDPQNGDWSMIHVRNSDNSTFRYCVIEFGQQGLNFWGGTPVISHCVIRWNNWEGLYFESYSKPIIEYTRIVENGYNGLAAEQFNEITMDYCEVWRNGTHGVHIDASTLEIKRSIVHDNNVSGLSVDDNGSISALGVSLNNNHQCGIVLGEGTNSVETSNVTFSGNPNGAVCGAHTEITSSFFAPEQIDYGFEPDQSYALGYIPGNQQLDKYMYVYPDDETRRIIKKIGQGLGLTWSLAWDGQYIWTATVGGIVYKLDPQTGNVMQQFTTTLSQPWGMTFDGEYLWLVDFAEKRMVKIDPSSGSELSSYPTPDPLGGCKGISWDGTYLNIMGWTSSKIYKMDRNGNLIKTITLNQGGGGITWDGSYFWVPDGGKIYKYDGNGNLVGWIYAASEGTWDLAWDGNNLWASQRTNENWLDDKIFQLEILHLQ